MLEAQATACPARRAPAERRQQQRHQYGDDGNNNKQFDEGEGPLRPPTVVLRPGRLG